MIFTSITDPMIQKAYEIGMKEMNDFWGINWVDHKPNVLIFNSKQEIDDWWGYKTEPWIRAWTRGFDICLISFDQYENITGSRITEENYGKSIKHELCHLFAWVASDKNKLPKWLMEGLACFLSGEMETKERPIEFSTFLDFYEDKGPWVYAESGFVVELLVNKLGKEKIVKLVKSLGGAPTEEGFKAKFKEIMGIDLTYEAINALYVS